jgi:hypothetical protein
MLDDLSLAGTAVTDWSFPRAILAMTLYKNGHNTQAVTLAGNHPHIAENNWLVSTDTTAHIYPSLTQAAAGIENQSSPVHHLTHIGALWSEMRHA